ncbi:hypothetical protein [Loktanella sp. M215]|uniref:hypothetical protein n=1 Tax=Loktanella sp. M215 TaxID=2675431 RepID=UPI001F30745E|nr:hypothetical protein [Loktanella sp. M215]MCF7699998.1 hypothetical protein [Loktanella sp. M215]
MLAYSRRAPLHPEPIDVVHCLIELEVLMRCVLKPDIGLTCRSSPQPLMVFVDRMQCDTVLLDLCINARVAIGDRGTTRAMRQNT